MTIRRLFWYALIGTNLLAALLVTLPAFYQGRRILLGHIETQLHQRARQLAQQIDMTLFERLVNMATWSRLRIMEELRAGDVDKRLSVFLRDLRRGYGGVYRLLAAADLDDRIVAASDPRWLGRRLSWQPGRRRFVVGGRTVEVLPSPAFDGLVFRSQIVDALGAPMGWLYAVVDWQALRQFLLQSTEAQASQIALLADAEGRVLAASRAAAENLPLTRLLKPLGQAGLHRFTLEGEVRVLTGSAHTEGWKGVPGLGWQVVLMVPAAEILAPLQRLWLSLAALLLAVLGASAVLSYVLANRIAAPLTRLTGFVRRYREGQALAVPEVHGSR